VVQKSWPKYIFGEALELFRIINRLRKNSNYYKFHKNIGSVLGDGPYYATLMANQKIIK